MILVAETVVDEEAVMVKLLYAAVAVVAVVGVLRAQILAVDTNVIHMKIELDKLAKEFDKVSGPWHVTRVRHCDQRVEKRGKKEPKA